MTKPISTIQTTRAYEGTSFFVTREKLLLPNGNTVERDYVRHPGAVVLLPQIGEQRLVLIRQYRHATGRELLEFPAGTLEVGEAPLACARRELSEETGYEADEWTSMGIAYPAPGFCDEIHHYFLARNLKPFSSQGDEDEFITVCEMNIGEVEKAIANDQLIDTKSITAFTKARAKGFI